MNSKNNIDLTSGSIDNSYNDPTGDPSIGYPQISIRTNRIAQRTELNAAINSANTIADQYSDDEEKRACNVMETLDSTFGGGNFGHSWIIIFHSDKEGDCSSYVYHERYGYVHNNDTNGHTNDSNTRGFAFQRIVPVGQDRIYFMENIIIPELNILSTDIGSSMDALPAKGMSGVYTVITNCSWFVGNIWDKITPDKIDFKQSFPGKDYAKRWALMRFVLYQKLQIQT